MRFLSTAGAAVPVSLGEALRRGLAADGGLFVPQQLEPLPASFFERLPGRGWAETTGELARHLLGGDFPPATLESIVAGALDFPIPLVELEDRVRILELFHGPTLAFKDVGARFLARLLGETREGDTPLTVLVATSGDTGGAVAQAFHGVPGTRVAILYPHGKVSPLQERQLATLGGNVRAFSVAGTFDDCQRLVKRAFAELELPGLTSANSINVGRLLPQIFYYFHAVAQLGAPPPGGHRVLFVTPSGNFGNLTAGLMAKRLGLDCRFVAATNVNDVVPAYLETGHFEPRPSLRTLSNAMDVGDPSNFARILHLYGGDREALRRDVEGRRYDDTATCEAIREVDRRHGYLMDPHTAVGYLALTDALREAPPEAVGIVLATAHPAKFLEVVEPVVGREVPLPPQLASRLGLPLVAEELPDDFAELRHRLLAW